MVKFTEHMRRKFIAIPSRIWAFAITLCCLCVTLYSLFSVLNIVIVSDSHGSRRMLLTPSEDQTQLMEMSGIIADEMDNVFYTAYNGNLASLNIQRAYEVKVTADGQTLSAKLCSGTVENVLEMCGLQLAEHDYTEPSRTTPVSPDMEPIVVHRVQYEDTVVQEEIPFETQYELTSLFVRNKRRTIVLQNGSNGIRETTTRQRVVDGNVESSKVIGVTEPVQPVNAIIKKYGEGAPVSKLKGPEGVTVNGGVPSSYKAVYTGRATGYSAARGRGSSGLGLYEGTVSVNPALIPYGSLLYITSTDGKFVYGYAIATDTGTALQSGHALVDLFYETYEESLLNGAKTVNVYVVQ
ncbi:MAG: 3D domain-containing protein [Oscillospiraceae bacterium]